MGTELMPEGNTMDEAFDIAAFNAGQSDFVTEVPFTLQDEGEDK